MTTRWIHPDALSEAEKTEMFRLMAAHYDGLTNENFRKDLADKDEVILLVHEGRIIGFSTQKIMEAEGVRAVFSGDTIIDRAHWGTQQLSRAFAARYFDHPQGPLYWFLTSKGFKTYKYLPTFFKEFYPRRDTETPPRIKSLLDALASAVYPDEYRKNTGIIVPAHDRDRLNRELVDLSERPNDPDYRFFVEKNPGFAQGHDLACITKLTRDNLRRGAERRLFDAS